MRTSFGMSAVVCTPLLLIAYGLSSCSSSFLDEGGGGGGHSRIDMDTMHDEK